MSRVPDLTGGLCRQSDPDLWSPATTGEARAAKAICVRCPEVAVCLAWALPRADLTGVWGATTRLERRAMRVEQARGVAA